MIRIRTISTVTTPTHRRLIAKAQQLLERRLPGVPSGEVDELADRLIHPVRYGFKAMLLVAEDVRGRMLGFALVSHDPELEFALLDYIVSSRELSPGGVGGALYNRVREHARSLGARALLFECLPDEPEAVSNPRFVASNAARLAFYEAFGARPITGTGYETPITPGGKDLPHLVFDDLDLGRPLRPAFARQAVRAILERKYSHLCSPQYIDAVVASFQDDPLQLRPPRYTHEGNGTPSAEAFVTLVVTDRHEIHHVRERGYVEAPVRIKAILDGILPTGLFRRVEPKVFPQSHIREIHDPAMVDYLQRACKSLRGNDTIYPYVFPIRNATRPPKDLAYRAGYYCIDTFTPIHRNSFIAAKRAVDCALTAAAAVLGGDRFAYALVRPPGHHAEHRSFGGFCYFNNAAAAAQYLSKHGRVAILDIDFHHGNGQQQIFYERADVFTVSIHGDPKIAYPFFTGFAEERGAGAGEGFNLNLALPEKVDGKRHKKALAGALEAIEKFDPAFLVVALGLDTAKADPTGSWSLGPADFEQNGRLIAALKRPTVVVQEGGYRSASLGPCARRFFQGLTADLARPDRKPAPRDPRRNRVPSSHGLRRSTGGADPRDPGSE